MEYHAVRVNGYWRILWHDEEEASGYYSDSLGRPLLFETMADAQAYIDELKEVYGGDGPTHTTSPHQKEEGH